MVVMVAVLVTVGPAVGILHTHTHTHTHTHKGHIMKKHSIKIPSTVKIEVCAHSKLPL